MEPLQQQIHSLEPLVQQLKGASDTHQKLEILNQHKEVQESPLLLPDLSPEEELAWKSILAIGQGAIVFRGLENQVEALHSLLQQLIVVEKFYTSIGGIVGYHGEVLKLLVGRESDPSKISSQTHYSKPPGLDISQDTAEVHAATVAGIERLGEMAEVYPVGGAGDRLNLFDEKTKKPLPAAKLQFDGRTLLEQLFRDLQAREYLHYKLTGKQLTTPVALMTSQEKNNHAYITAICEENGWFGRPRESIVLFEQPLVPVINMEGNWSLTAPLQLKLKPGGHGVIWKLMQEKGVLNWLRSQGRRKVLLRQINNPIANTDHGLLAFTGVGCEGDKAFGFVSCYRLVNSAEGMVVLIETETHNGIDCCITNIEYTDFAKRGIEDAPLEEGSPYSLYPSNTNILFADINAVEEVINENPIPGMAINLKHKAPYFSPEGVHREIKAGRLESLMQNVADYLIDHQKEHLRSYLTYNDRAKTLSVTKNSFTPGKSMLETPEGAFYDLMKIYDQLLRDRCQMDLPSFFDADTYLEKGPSILVRMHPALGPLHAVIAQKIQGGSITQGSELELEIAELQMTNLTLEGSLRIIADSPLGNKNKEGIITYSDNSGKCVLQNVQVHNAGVDANAENIFWKNTIARKESVTISIEGNGEFFASDVTFEGNHQFAVPSGYRMEVKMGEVGEVGEKGVEISVEPIVKETWSWKYRCDEGVLKVQR